MRAFLQSCFLLFWIANGIFTFAQQPEIFVDIWRYQQISGNTYENNGKVEVYFRVSGNSLRYEPQPNQSFLATIEVSCKIFRLRDADSLWIDTRERKLQLTATNKQNELKLYPALVDMEVFTLPTGTYFLQVEVLDLRAPSAQPSRFHREFIMPPPALKAFAFSDIAIVRDDPVRMRLKKRILGQKYEPQGKFFTPLITNESLVNEDSLVCYVQLYNAESLAEENQLIERVSITKNGRNVQPPHTEVEENPSNFQVFIHTFDISKLSNDTYHLTIDLLDSKGDIIRTTWKKFYLYNYRSENEFKYFVSDVFAGDLLNEFDEDAIRHHIQTLTPISDEQEIQFSQVLRSYEQMKNYVYSFWNKRKQGDLTLIELIKGYQALVKYVDQKFGVAPLEGWQTDQGRIWLKYGAPNERERFPATPSEFPYEIWRYSRLGNQNNVSFVFCNPMSEVNRFTLIHSDKYGELKNLRWRVQVAR
ncbi:MAG: GWxTD domain-containing protein [Bacteroidota bacterium]